MVDAVTPRSASSFSPEPSGLSGLPISPKEADKVTDVSLQHLVDLPQDPHKLTASNLQRENQSVNILDGPAIPQSMKDLETALTLTEKKIEIDLAKLDEYLSAIDSYKDRNQRPLSDEESEFLQTVLPDSIRARPKVFERFRHFRELVRLSDGFLKAVNNRHDWLIPLYKAEMKRASEELRNDIKQYSYALSFNGISDKEVEEVNQSIKAWNVESDLKNEEWDVSYVEYGATGASYVISFFDFLTSYIPVRFMPFALLLETGKQVVARVAGVIQVIELITSGVNAYHSMKYASIANRWIAGYNEWKKENAAAKAVEIDSNQIDVSDGRFLSDETHLRNLTKLIEESDFDTLRALLQETGVDVPDSVTTGEQFAEKIKTDPEFKKEIESGYLASRKEYEGLDLLFNQADNLLEKRRSIREKNILLLMPQFDNLKSKIFDMQKKEFDGAIKRCRNLIENGALSPIEREKIENEITKWASDPASESEIREIEDLILASDFAELENRFIARFDTQSPEACLSYYIDKQETLDITVKHALNSLITKKLEIDKKFISFDFLSDARSFIARGSGLALAATLVTLGLISLTVPGVGWMVLAFTVWQTALSLSLMSAGFYLAFKYKPRSTVVSYAIKDVVLLYQDTRLQIRDYINSFKQKKFLVAVDTLNKLKIATDQKNEKKIKIAEERYEKALTALKYGQERIRHWEEQVENSRKIIDSSALNDFAVQANLPVDPEGGKDSLTDLANAVSALDSDIISEELKYLLETQTGLKPEAPQVKELLLKFFSSTHSELIRFMKRQTALSKK